MTLRCALLALLLALLALPVAAETASVRDILMDGDSSDFDEDEAVFEPAEETTIDSHWGENNDINQVKLTWDEERLYVAVDGRCWGNNIMLFFDTDSLGGFRNQDLLNAWARKLRFETRLPDFFLGTWDTGTWPDAPQLWRLEPGSTTNVLQMSQNSEYLGASTFSQGQTGASMEAAIPWSSLYPNAEGVTIPVGAEIAVVAVLVTGGDHNSGPDCAPNNVLDMPINSGDFADIDNFAVFRLDRDENGEADLGVSPNSREGDEISELAPLRFLHPPDAEIKELKFVQAKALRGAFSPNGDGIEDEGEITFTISAPGRVTANIHDMQGNKLRTLFFEKRFLDEVPYSIFWDGKDDRGRDMEAGVYIVRLQAGFRDRVTIPVAVLR